MPEPDRTSSPHRSRALIEAFEARNQLVEAGLAESAPVVRRLSRRGAYWSIRTNLADYGLHDALDCPFDKTLQLAEESTRLARMRAGTQERLINWGYAVCDAALRRHYDPGLPAPGGFPYAGGVD